MTSRTNNPLRLSSARLVRAQESYVEVPRDN
jgi:hypothetical protein